jgi:hypothetical protein
MNTLLNFFNQAIKRNGKACTIHSNTFMAVFKEISDNKTSIDSKYLLTEYDLKQGDIITYNSNKYFIITKNENINNVYNIYTIQKVFQTVNMPIGAVLYIEDSIFNNSNTMIDYNTYINLLNGHVTLQLQENDITNQVTIGTRFIKFNHAWKIISIDKSKEGLINIIGDIDPIITGDNADDLVNEIPSGTHFPSTDPIVFKVTLPTDYDSKVAGNGAYKILEDNTYNFEFYAMEGTTQHTDTFTLSYSYVGSEYTITNLTGNSFSITDNSAYFDDNLYITCTDNTDGSLVGTIIIEIGGAW